MNEEELANLVVRLTGDPSGYERMLRQIQDGTEGVTKTVEAAAKKVEGLGQGLLKFAQGAASAIAAYGITSKLKEFFGLYSQQEETLLRLKGALMANGREVQKTTEEYTEFAKAVSDVTTTGKDSTLAMLAQAESFGLTGEAAQRAVRNVISAQAAGLPASLRMMAMLEQGQTLMLNRLIPGLRQIKDPAEKAAKAQDMLNKMWNVAVETAKGAGGQIKQLENSVKSLEKEFGSIIAEAIKPIIGWFREGVKWFKSLSAETKTTIVTIMALAAAFLALGPLIAGLSLLLGTLFNPVVIVLGLIGAGVAAWINAMGGVGKAWEYVTAKAKEFWEWLLPIRQAAVSLWGAVQEAATQAWDMIKKAAGDAWAWITTNFNVNWNDVRDAFRDGIIALEYGIRNIGKVWDYVWTGIQLAAVSALNVVSDFLRDNWLTLVFGPVIGSMVKNWQGGLDSMFGSFNEFITGLIPTITKFSKAFFDALHGKIPTWAGVMGNQLEHQFSFAFQGASTGDLKALEAQLRQSFEEQGAALGKGFAEFRDAKLKEWAAQGKIPPEMVEAAKGIGQNMGQATAKAMGKEISNATAVLFGSAEAKARLEAYREAVVIPTREARGTKDPNTKILEDIRDILRDKQEEATDLALDAAGFGFD